VLDAARRGDRHALETLVTAHYDRVHALCRRMLGNDSDALDATQDTLVAAIRGLGRFDGRSSFGTWIYRIATNTCIDEMRRRRRRPVIGLVADVAQTADEFSFGAPGLFVVPRATDADRSDDIGESRDAGARGTGGAGGAGGFGGAGGLGGFGAAGGGRDPADIVAARVDVDTALASLPLEFRTAVVLRDVCDLPYDEIAEILGVPVGTIRSRIARARSALAATWATEATEATDATDATDVAGANDATEANEATEATEANDATEATEQGWESEEIVDSGTGNHSGTPDVRRSGAVTEQTRGDEHSR
jgi:RNA polymerase sigma-70 factor (ECF subfamily)